MTVERYQLASKVAALCHYLWLFGLRLVNDLIAERSRCETFPVSVMPRCGWLVVMGTAKIASLVNCNVAT